jgi:transcriptional regulator with XRE-family HTH domain
MEQKIDLRERLRVLSGLAGLSQQNIADLLEISQSTVGRYLRQETDLHYELLEKWCEEVGTNMVELYEASMGVLGEKAVQVGKKNRARK